MITNNIKNLLIAFKSNLSSKNPRINIKLENIKNKLNSNCSPIKLNILLRKKNKNKFKIRYTPPNKGVAIECFFLD